MILNQNKTLSKYGFAINNSGGGGHSCDCRGLTAFVDLYGKVVGKYTTTHGCPGILNPGLNCGILTAYLNRCVSTGFVNHQQQHSLTSIIISPNRNAIKTSLKPPPSNGTLEKVDRAKTSEKMVPL